MGTNIEESIKQGLSKREALALTRLASQNRSIIQIDDLEDAVDVSYESAKKMAHNLVEKQWLEPLKRGTYLIVPLAAGETGEYTEHEFIIASHLAEKMYISYWSALNHHGLTEQVPTTVFAATPGRVTSREIHGVTYKFVTLNEIKFFGYKPEAISSHKVNIASVEKTLVDCADHPEHCGGIAELANAFANASNIDSDTLTQDVLKIGNGAAVKRIVYLADLFDIKLPRRDELENAFTSGYSKLDPTRGKNGRYTSKYRLLLNVDEDELLKAGGGP